MKAVRVAAVTTLAALTSACSPSAPPAPEPRAEVVERSGLDTSSPEAFLQSFRSGTRDLSADQRYRAAWGALIASHAAFPSMMVETPVPYPRAAWGRPEMLLGEEEVMKGSERPVAEVIVSGGGAERIAGMEIADLIAVYDAVLEDAIAREAETGPTYAERSASAQRDLPDHPIVVTDATVLEEGFVLRPDQIRARVRVTLSNTSDLTVAYPVAELRLVSRTVPSVAFYQSGLEPTPALNGRVFIQPGEQRDVDYILYGNRLTHALPDDARGPEDFEVRLGSIVAAVDGATHRIYDGTPN